MGWLEATTVVAVVLTIFSTVTGGIRVAAAARRKRSRARGPFLVGLVCGVVAGAALTAERRWLNPFGISPLNTVAGQLIRRRQMPRSVRLSAHVLHRLVGNHSVNQPRKADPGLRFVR